MPYSPIDLAQYATPDEVNVRLRADLIACWIAVSNAGGAAGFPFPPVDASDVTPVADQLIGGLEPQRSRLIVAIHDGRLAGWVSLSRDLNPLVAHWGVVRHLQSHPELEGRGIATALMGRLHNVAREEMGLSQLHLAVRGGIGLEAFYERLGWREIGRWPSALRFPSGDRDEVMMVRDPL